MKTVCLLTKSFDEDIFRKLSGMPELAQIQKYSRTSNSGHFYRQGQVAVIGRWPLLGGGRFQRCTTIWESVWD